MNRHLPSAILPALTIAVLVMIPARSADADIAQASWMLPLSIHQDTERLSDLKRKWAIARPPVETAHTNQPPAPPAPPDSPLRDPGQGHDKKRGIDLTPSPGTIVPAADPLPLPDAGVLIGVELPEPTIGGTGISLAAIDSFAAPDEDLLLDPGTSGVGTAAPSVVPGPGALGLLVAAGLASGRRRRRG